MSQLAADLQYAELMHAKRLAAKLSEAELPPRRDKVTVCGATRSGAAVCDANRLSEAARSGTALGWDKATCSGPAVCGAAECNATGCEAIRSRTALGWDNTTVCGATRSGADAANSREAPVCEANRSGPTFGLGK